MNITEKTNKDEILSHSMEIMSDLDTKVETYKQERLVMAGIIAFLCLTNFVF